VNLTMKKMKKIHVADSVVTNRRYNDKLIFLNIYIYVRSNFIYLIA
jgi:hypothetical protein